MIPVTYGYTRVSKADRDDKNLDTQLHELGQYGLRRDLIFVDDETRTTFKRPGWDQPRSTSSLTIPSSSPGKNLLYRSSDEEVAIQVHLTQREIWIVAIRENIDARDGNDGAKFYRRMMLAQGAYQADSTSERIRAGLYRVRAEDKKLGHPPALIRSGAWRPNESTPRTRRSAVPPGS